MRITVIDDQTGDIHAVETLQKPAEDAPFVFDSESGPVVLTSESASETAAAWQPVHFKDGTVIEVNTESGEIVGQ